MKKIININFQGRIIPIEETSYDILKDYLESLRAYFAREEGGDEIMNDIEGRIAELFSQRLKNTACITDEDVNAVIASIGRPQDFEEADVAGSAREKSFSESTGEGTSTEPRRWYRAKNDKIIGGVCAGLANYLKIDPTIVRILFALITFGAFGTGILLYIILWAILPAKTLEPNIRKRLFRNSDNYMLGGVASGLATYFNIEVWVTRLIFCLPLILGIFTSFSNHWFNFYDGPGFITSGFSGTIISGLGGTIILTYIVLWIILPKARSASEKLEMRGEKINLASIKNTVKEEHTSAKRHSTESGIGHAIRVLFKAFFLFIAGIIALALITALMAILFGGVVGGAGVLPFKNFILETPLQHFLAWCSLLLFLGIPAIALLTWLIRSIMGIRSQRHYLRYIFLTLWLIGLISTFTLAALIGRNFKVKNTVEETVMLSQPTDGKFYVKIKEGIKEQYRYREGWDDDLLFFGQDNDSLFLNLVQLDIIQSNDSAYHVHTLKSANAATRTKANDLASAIHFEIHQQDGMLLLPKGFPISSHEKFRNQRVLLVIEVPVGKKIEIDENINSYNWFNIGPDRHNRWNNGDWEQGWEGEYNWKTGREYLMTEDGLIKAENINSAIRQFDNV